MPLQGIGLAIVVAGLALAFGGLWLYEITVSIVGFAIGGGAGFFVANSGLVFESKPDLVVLAAIVIGGGIVGAGLIWIVLRIVVMAPGFAAGALLAKIYVAPELEGLAAWGAIAIIGIIGAALAWAIHELAIAVVSAFIGATVVTLGLAGDDIVTVLVNTGEQYASLAETFLATGSAPLFVPEYATTGTFLAVFVLGVLSQLGGRHRIAGLDFLPGSGSED